MYGREAVLPVQVKEHSTDSTTVEVPMETAEEVIKACVESLQKIRDEVYPVAEGNTKVAQA